MAPMATTLPARNRYGTRSAIVGPGVPWRTSLIHRMGWRMGWPTAKKIQKLRAALASVGSATLTFIWLTDWKKSAQAPPWMAMPPMLKASESKRGKAEDIGRNIRQGAAVAATGVLLHLVGVSATGLLHPGRHLEQLHERIGKGHIGLLADNGLGRTKSQLQLAINKFLYTIFSASRAEQNHILMFSTNMIAVIQFLSLQMPGDHHPVRPRFCHGGLVPTNPPGRSTGGLVSLP